MSFVVGDLICNHPHEAVLLLGGSRVIFEVPEGVSFAKINKYGLIALNKNLHDKTVRTVF
jgi:hypothetical protein